MSRSFWWTNSRAQLAMLLQLLIVIAVVQVLPQVDLPDTAFHGDSAPIIVKSRAVSVPALGVAIPGTLLAPLAAVPATVASETSPITVHPVNEFLPILLSTLLC